MPAPLVIAGALALSKLQEKKAQEEAEKQAKARLYASQAAQYGYPTMGYEAMGQRADIDAIEGPNYLGMLLDAEEKKKAQGGGAMGSKDYFSAFMS